ncbi:MAG: phosphoserine phosphatase RsbU/P [Blastocatellia bacterium]|jgi:sigma-B regulation protein RsbU (phosphoserine phosphatase)|nr:phosphoserine phosphatase RsbU/P [Blastocatellia bacterium]
MNLANVQSQAPIPRTLIADDQPDIAAALHLLLREAGYQTEAVTTPAAVLDAIKQREFDLVLIDLNYARDTTSGQEGLDLITNIKKLDSTLPVVVLTGWGTVELAVEAMHRGVHDFVQKPWDNHALLKILRNQIEQGRARRRQTDLDQQRHQEGEKIQQELAEAREIQRALLPKILPRFDGLDIAVAWKPAQEVSGDYFDLLRLGDHHAGICIADVAGKGMSAALLMSNVQAVLKSFASDRIAPSELCTRVNSVVCKNIVPNRFISCFYGLFDTRTSKLSYTNAGHYSPLLMRAGECLRLTGGGAVLGVLANGTYEQYEIELQRGDCLVLFTDGVTEACNAEGREFGEDRLQDLLTGAQELTADELRDRIMDAVNEFSDGPLYDDATLIVVRVN